MLRLAYPCWVAYMVLILGIPSKRLCDIYYLMIDYVHDRYARKPNHFEIWVFKFSEFSAVFWRAGSPYPNQIMNFDCNFKGCCHPGGFANVLCRLDQSEIFTG
jgi:hypothetical protein